MTLPCPKPRAVPDPGDPAAIEALLATLSQMVARCEEMVTALERGALIVRNDPLRRPPTTTSID